MPLSHLPVEKRALLLDVIQSLADIPGVAAVVLGGSYASHTHHAASDLDVGIYYSENQPFEIEAIRQVARTFSVEGDPVVTGFYGWGPWVNGGAWIHTAHGKVDFIYRNIEHLRRTIEEAQAGIVHHDYGQQPAYGFFSTTYLAETQVCIPLYDPDKILAGLKQMVAIYPARLKEKLIADHLWSVEFTLIHAQGFAEKGDVYNTAGCLTRAAFSLTQVLFAMNERYFMRDKQTIQTLAGFSILPPGYTEQIQQILASPGHSALELSSSVENMYQVWNSLVVLTDGKYQPKFKFTTRASK